MGADNKPKVDAAKGNELLKKLLGTRPLPIVQDAPAPAETDAKMPEALPSVPPLRSRSEK